MTPKKPNPKMRENLLAAARELMLAKGYGATSVDEICKKAKVTKGCFFHYFDSKEALAKALLNQFCCASQEAIKENCHCGEGTRDPLKRVYQYIEFAKSMAENPETAQGCLIGMFSQELSDTHPQLREICQKGFKDWMQMLVNDLKEAKRVYKPKVNFNPESLALMFISTFEGALILAKAHQDDKIIDKTLDNLRNYIFLIFKR